MKSYFRSEIEAMSGYVPGEQPKLNRLVKLNTNENPYPPSIRIRKLLADFDLDRLRRYPDPTADEFRDAVASRWGITRDQVIAGNGSDDILTMVFRAFAAPDLPVACPEPTYSLYPVLAAMQGAPVRRIALQPGTFALPDDFLEQVRGANLLAIARPNAPTGNSFPLSVMAEICDRFDGMVLIDEAYADFAEDHCAELAVSRPNVIVSRTFSKSYSLAGLRLGYAVAHPQVIAGLMKLKDSYNLDALTQAVGLAAYEDTDYHEECVKRVKEVRAGLLKELLNLGFEVVPSETNFLFAAPPGGDGEGYFRYLREQAVIVRYFPGPVTGRYVRITIGTPEQMQELLTVTRHWLSGR